MHSVFAQALRASGGPLRKTCPPRPTGSGRFAIKAGRPAEKRAGRNPQLRLLEKQPPIAGASGHLVNFHQSLASRAADA